MKINLICYTSLKKENEVGTENNNEYVVLINTTEPKFFPVKEDHAKRIVDFGENKVAEGKYYILWNADIDQKTRKITASKITQIQPTSSIEVKPQKESEPFILENIVDTKKDVNQITENKFSESIISQIIDPLIYPNNLCLN